MKTVKLIMVTEKNNNKYYNLSENSDCTFTVEYGRVGANAQTRTYPMSQWNRRYNEKVRKGYVDNTELFKEEVVGDSNTTKVDTFKPERSKSVISIINKLQGWANKSVQQNYTVSSDEVTQLQIDEAQTVIDNLVSFDLKKSTIEDFNKILLNFYTIVPRKMKQVKDHLISNDIKVSELKDRKNEIISSEQDTLDVMAGQVKLNKTNSNDTPVDDTDTNEQDILDVSGLEVVEVTDVKIIDMIKSKMQTDSSRLQKVYEVINKETQKLFDTHIKDAKHKDIDLLWHGSRNENWWSIITTGLKIRPSSNVVTTGKMFGKATYFANKAKKSMGYTSIRGSYWSGGSSDEAVLALYEVHTGKQKIIKKHDSSCYDLDYNVVTKEGYDSVYAMGGIDLINDEFMVYHSNQSTIKYLVVIK